MKRATTTVALNRITKIYLEKMGNVKRILSDQGTQFLSARWKSTLESLGIEVVYTSVRHPQANPSERVMRELGRLCRAFCQDQHTRWAYELPKFADFMNTVVHDSTGYAPKELQFGTERERLLPDSLQGPPSGPAATYEQKLILARETFLTKAARRRAQQTNFRDVKFKTRRFSFA